VTGPQFSQSFSERSMPAAPVRRSSLASLAGNTFFGVASVVFFVFGTFWNSFGGPWGPGTSALLASLVFALHFLLSARRASALDPVVWVPVAMLIFYFGLPVAIELLGHSGPRGYNAMGEGLNLPRNLARGYCLSLLTITSFIWGIHLVGLRDLSAGPARNPNRDNSLLPAGLVLTIGAMAMFSAGVAIMGPSVVFGRWVEYWEAKASGADPRLVDMGFVFWECGIFVLIASYDRRRKLINAFMWCSAALLAGILVQNGNRSNLIQLAIGVGWCYSQRVRRIPPVPIATAAVVALLLVPVLKEWRDFRSVEISTRSSPIALAGKALYEMGSSGLIFPYTLDYIPSQKPYALGSSFLWAALGLIPNVGLTPRTQGFQSGDTHPAEWLARTLSPNPHSVVGYGYTMGAEWYFNFGTPGVLLGSALLGFLVTRLRNSAQTSSLKLVVSALAFAAMAGYVRNIIGYSLRFLVWPLWGLLLIRFILSLLVRRPPAAARLGSVPTSGI